MLVQINYSLLTGHRAISRARDLAATQPSEMHNAVPVCSLKPHWVTPMLGPETPPVNCSDKALKFHF